MLRVIRLTEPTWVIAENVYGLVTWNEGMVLEQVCTDLEGEGYEVQPFIIPAVAVNAPHRRDRVWIVANKQGEGLSESRETRGKTVEGCTCGGGFTNNAKYTYNAEQSRLEGYSNPDQEKKRREGTARSDAETGWERNWVEVATELCGVDDGLPAELDGLKLSKASHRVQRLKALGNAIVPQVAIQIMQAIKQSTQLSHR